MKKNILLLSAALATFSAVQAQTARVQVIHNCADAAAQTVDVYINGTMLLDDFEFRTASPFVDAPAGVPLSVAVAPGNSTSVADAIYTVNPTLTANEKYIVVANGIVSASGYSPAAPFVLDLYGMGREAAIMAANTDVLVMHGSTDAPTVDVVAVGAGTVVDDASYGDFAGYLELPTADYTLNITDASGATTVASYQAPLATLNLQGAALVVLASGFLNPANNSNGPAFGLWAAPAAGGDLVALPSAPLSVKPQTFAGLSVWPNPATDAVYFRYNATGAEDLTLELTTIDGKFISRNIYPVAVSAGGSVAVPVNGLPSGTYLLRFANSSEAYVQRVTKL